MRKLTPQSEDFLYWAPEEIRNYPWPPVPEAQRMSEEHQIEPHNESGEHRHG